MSGFYSIPSYDHKKISAIAAFLAHLVLFALSGAAFSQPAQFGVETGLGGIEVHLAAAPAVVEAPSIAQPAPETAMVDRLAEAQSLPPQAPEIRGDGSSPVPGKDPTTLHTAGGAETLAKPNYLKNPAPRYPEEARRKAQQGVVLLLARVNSAGSADGVVLKTSSGFLLLDEAALRAVRGWKFQPARLGSVPVDSNVQIPVRFKLDKN